MDLKGKIVLGNEIGGRFELAPFQSPRGCRINNERPTNIKIEIKGNLDNLEFTSLIDWLIVLQMSMVVKLEAPKFPADRIEKF